VQRLGRGPAGDRPPFPSGGAFTIALVHSPEIYDVAAIDAIMRRKIELQKRTIVEGSVTRSPRTVRLVRAPSRN